jgi:hypothetical protein
MSPRKTREIKAALEHKGFVKSNSDHEVFRLRVKGKITSIRTHLSHGSNEYNDNLLALVARQLKLRRSQLNDLIDCPLSGEEYVAQLVRNGDIKLD